MTHDHALLHDAVLIKLRLAHLKEHFLDRGERGVDVIRRERQLHRQTVVAVFEVGQPDIHQPVEQRQYFRREIAAAVVDNGNIRAVDPQALGDCLGKMVGGHEVDIVDAAFFEHTVTLRKLRRRERFALLLRGYLIVLTEHAPHRAA